MLTDEEVKNIPKTIGRIERRYRNMSELDEVAEEKDIDDKDKCPDCGAPLVFQAGCEKCSNPDCVYVGCG